MFQIFACFIVGNTNRSVRFPDDRIRSAGNSDAAFIFSREFLLCRFDLHIFNRIIAVLNCFPEILTVFIGIPLIHRRTFCKKARKKLLRIRKKIFPRCMSAAAVFHCLMHQTSEICRTDDLKYIICFLRLQTHDILIAEGSRTFQICFDLTGCQRMEDSFSRRFFFRFRLICCDSFAAEICPSDLCHAGEILRKISGMCNRFHECIFIRSAGFQIQRIQHRRCIVRFQFCGVIGRITEQYARLKSRCSDQQIMQEHLRLTDQTAGCGCILSEY